MQAIFTRGLHTSPAICALEEDCTQLHLFASYKVVAQNPIYLCVVRRLCTTVCNLHVARELLQLPFLDIIRGLHSTTYNLGAAMDFHTMASYLEAAKVLHETPCYCVLLRGCTQLFYLVAARDWIQPLYIGIARRCTYLTFTLELLGCCMQLLLAWMLLGVMCNLL